MGDILRPSDSGSGAPDTRIFIQCVNVRDTMAHELWPHGLEKLSRDVHPAARVDISTGTVG